MNMVKPDGTTVWVPDESLKQAQAAGYKPETADQAARRQAGEHPVQAFAEGAARTATFGLSDEAIAGFEKGRGNEQGGQNLSLRQQENPIAAGAGEIAGLFTPGPGAVGRAAESMTVNIGSKLLRRGVRGAVEGGIFGLGNAISEDAMGEPDLAGEHVAANVLGGALGGAGINVVGGAVGDMGRSALIKAFGGKTLKETLDKAAETAFMRSISTPADLARKSTRQNLTEMYQFATKEGLGKGVPSKATVATRAFDRAEKAWDEMGSALSEFDKAEIQKQVGEQVVPGIDLGAGTQREFPFATQIPKREIPITADLETGNSMPKVKTGPEGQLELSLEQQGRGEPGAHKTIYHIAENGQGEFGIIAEHDKHSELIKSFKTREEAEKALKKLPKPEIPGATKVVTGPQGQLDMFLENQPAPEVAQQVVGSKTVGGSTGTSGEQFNLPLASEATKKPVFEAQNFDAKAAADRMQPVLNELKHNPAASSVRENLQNLIDEFRDPARAPKTFSQAWETAKWMRLRVGETEPRGMKDVLFKLRGEFQDEIFNQAKVIDPKLGAGLERANRDYYLSNRIGELAQKAADKTQGSVNLYDAMASAAGMMAHGPAGILYGVGAHLARDRGGFVLANTLEKLSNSQTFERIAQGLKKVIQTGLDGSSAFGGAFRATLENASARGADELLHEHLRLAASDPSYLSSVGMKDEEPNTVPEYVDKAHRLSTMYNAVNAQGATVDKAIDRFLKGKSVPKKDREPTRAQYDQVMKSINQILGDENMIRKQLADTAPTTSGIAQMTAITAAKYLKDQAPKNPTAGMAPALQLPWNPSKADLRTWFRCVDAVADPGSVIEDMARGTVTKEGLDALRAVYPRLYQDFKERMNNKLGTLEQPLDMKKRAQLSALIGDLDNPQVVSLIQGVHQRSNPPVSPNKPDGRQQLDVEKNLQTQAERLEGK